MCCDFRLESDLINRPKKLKILFKMLTSDRLRSVIKLDVAIHSK